MLRSLDEDTDIDAADPDAHLFKARRTALWSVKLGFYLGQGYSSPAVAKMLGDDTHPATVRGRARRAGILPAKLLEMMIPVRMPSWQRDIIERHAAGRGLTLEQIIAQVLESALVLDDLYDAVTDGRYAMPKAVSAATTP